MVNFLKGIVAGIGGIAPGLSGTVLLILMGLYRPVLDALGSVFSDFKKKVRFLLPIVAGMILGVLVFSRVIGLCLERWEMPTRFCFLGLILGTVPLLWKEVGQKGMKWGHYLMIAAGILVGIGFFAGNPGGRSPDSAAEYFPIPGAWPGGGGFCHHSGIGSHGTAVQSGAL